MRGRRVITRRPGSIAVGCAVAVVMLGGVSGCKTYVIEYHDRPAFFEAAGQPLPESQTLPDGRVIVYRTRHPEGALQESAKGDEKKPFLVREELEDGTIVMRAILPEHVLSNTFSCLRNQEYELLWEQVIAQATRDEYQRNGQGFAEFESFCREYRNDLAATINRMGYGLLNQQVVIDNLGGGITRYRFHPTAAAELRFKAVLMCSEVDGMKLLRVQQ